MKLRLSAGRLVTGWIMRSPLKKSTAGWGSKHCVWAKAPRVPRSPRAASATYLIWVKAHVPKLAPLQPLHQGHLLVSQPYVMPGHPVLHCAPGGPPIRAVGSALGPAPPPKEAPPGSPVVRVVHSVQELVQLVPGAHGLIDAPAIQVVAHVREVLIPLQGHVAHRVPHILGQQASMSALDTHCAHPSLQAAQDK